MRKSKTLCGAFRKDYTAVMERNDEIWQFVDTGELVINAIGEMSMKVRKGNGWTWSDISNPDILGSEAADELSELWQALTSTCEKALGRFHFRGGTSAGKVHMRLSTEFLQDITRKYFWRRVHSFAFNTGGVVREIDRDFSWAVTCCRSISKWFGTSTA